MAIEIPDYVDESDRRHYAWLDRVEWHCEGRHGVLRNLSESEWHEAAKALWYFYLAKPNHGLWTKKIGPGRYDVEFTHQAKVFPPPTKPWEWCGKSVLFEEWHEQARAAQAARRQWQVGMRCQFRGTHGHAVTGVVIGVGPKNIKVLADGDTSGRFWRVSPILLREHKEGQNA